MLSVFSNTLHGRLHTLDSQVEFNIYEWEKKVVSLDQHVEFYLDIHPTALVLHLPTLSCLEHVQAKATLALRGQRSREPLEDNTNDCVLGGHTMLLFHGQTS